MLLLCVCTFCPAATVCFRVRKRLREWMASQYNGEQHLTSLKRQCTFWLNNSNNYSYNIPVVFMIHSVHIKRIITINNKAQILPERISTIYILHIIFCIVTKSLNSLFLAVAVVIFALISIACTLFDVCSFSLAQPMSHMFHLESDWTMKINC